MGYFEAVARDWPKTVHEVKISAGHAKRTRIRLEQDAFPESAADWFLMQRWAASSAPPRGTVSRRAGQTR